MLQHKAAFKKEAASKKNNNNNTEYTFKIVSGDQDLHPRWLP
jgi:hypothetical protein